MELQPDSSTFKNYLSFFTGQQFSLLGSSISQFAILLWLTEMAGKVNAPLYLAIASFVGFVPMVLLSPFAGVFVDRWNRRILIGIADSLQALSTVFLIVLFWYNLASLYLVMAVLAFKGIFQAFHAPAVQAIIPIMVPREKLSRINSVSYFLMGAVTLIGPVMAAALLAYLPIETVLWIDPITFMIAVFPLLLIRIPSVRIGQEKTSFKNDFVGGINFIMKAKGLVPMVVLATSLNFLLMPLATQLPYFVIYDHFGSGTELALVVAAFQAGMLIGGLMMIMLKDLKNKMRAIAICLLITFIAYALVPAAPTGWFWLIMIWLFIMDFFVAPANISIRTILQVVIPVEMQGRINSVLNSLASAASPAGMIISGVLISAIGSFNLFVGCALTGIAMLSGFWFFTDLRHLEQAAQNPAPIPQQSNELIGRASQPDSSTS